MTYRGVWDDAPTTPTGPQPAHRSRRPNLLAAALTLVVLAAFGGVSAVALQPSRIARTAATRFVARDGFQPMAAWTVNGASSRAMVDHARLRGYQIQDALPLPMVKTSLPYQIDVGRYAWWRTGIIIDDPQVWNRYRYGEITTTGDVILRGQSWGTLGLSLDGLLALPAQVRPGLTWHSSGRALARPTSRQLSFDNTSTAAVAPAPYGKRGCLQVKSTTRLTSEDQPDENWSEQNIWCPGQGIVTSIGSWRDTTWALSVAEGRPVDRLDADVLADAVPDPAEHAQWHHEKVKIVSGDPTFGLEQPPLTTPPLTPVVTTSSTIGLVTFGSADLGQMYALLKGSRWWLNYWARASPGESGPRGSSKIVTLTAFGNALVTTTTARQIICYLEGGRRAWSTRLDETVVAPPIRVREDRIAVATLAGTIYLLDATNGSVVWRYQYDRGFSLPLASNGTVIAGIADDSELVVVDAATGDVRWTQEGSGAETGVAVSDDVVSTRTAGMGEGYDEDTGAPLWTHTFWGTGGTIVGNGDQFAVATNLGVVGLNARDASVRWRLEGAAAPVRVRSHWAMLTGDRLVLVDQAGMIQQRWPLRRGITDPHLVVGGNRLWVFGTIDDSLVIQWVGSP